MSSDYQKSDKTLRWRDYAHELAKVTERVTGDTCLVVESTARGGGKAWLVLRLDPSGKEFEV